jgi:RHS repeat-associated protein
VNEATFSYGPNMPDPGDIGPETPTTSPAYDANGNLINYKGSIYTYDAQNRLTGASNGATTATFYYDGKNRQIARNITGVIQSNVIRISVWDGWELIEEYASSTSRAAAYLQGAHGVIKSLQNNVYYYQDKLGSTTHVANASGQLLESYRYDLYGTPSYFNEATQPSQPINSSTVGITDLYAGERWIPDLGLYDLRNRFMSPELGRFLQPDPIGFKGDASNLYRYCHNDPEDFSDPMGLVAASNSAIPDRLWERACFFDSGNSFQGSLQEFEQRRSAAGTDGGAGYPRDMASHAESNVNSMKYHNTKNMGGWGRQDVYHCNEFPGDMAEASGRVRPKVWVPARGSGRAYVPGQWRNALSNELANPSVKIPHWSGPRPLSEARRNDIIAQQHGRDGHAGVVTSQGNSITVNTAKGGMVEAEHWGFRSFPKNGEKPGDPAPVVRHYLPGTSGEW